MKKFFSVYIFPFLITYAAGVVGFKGIVNHDLFILDLIGIYLIMLTMANIDRSESKRLFIKRRISIAIILTIYFVFVCICIHGLYLKESAWTPESKVALLLLGPVYIVGIGLLIVWALLFLVTPFKEDFSLYKRFREWTFEIAEALILPVTVYSGLALCYMAWVGKK